MESSGSELSKLQRVGVREVWAHEALDFTRWLALEENLEALSEALGIDIVNPQTEAAVGALKVDILAEDDDGRSIVVENQLESSDHDHLGKLLTYAAGLDARTAVWIVDEAREEHVGAIAWLNDQTSDNANFFLIQLEVWKIDDSRPAPRFRVISQPNGWTKAARSGKNSGEPSNLKRQHQEFFAQLRDYAVGKAPNIFRWQTPQPRHWYTVAVGRSGAHLAAKVNSQTDTIAVELYIRNDDAMFEWLEGRKSEIEDELGFSADWQPLPNRKGSRVVVERSADYTKPEDRTEIFEWLVHRLDAMSRVFRQELSTYDAGSENTLPSD